MFATSSSAPRKEFLLLYGQYLFQMPTKQQMASRRHQCLRLAHRKSVDKRTCRRLSVIPLPKSADYNLNANEFNEIINFYIP